MNFDTRAFRESGGGGVARYGKGTLETGEPGAAGWDDTFRRVPGVQLITIRCLGNDDPRWDGSEREQCHCLSGRAPGCAETGCV